MQKVASSNPVEVQIDLVSKYQRKKADEELRQLKSQLSNIKDEGARQQLSGVIDDLMGKGFGNEITVKLKSTLTDAAKTVINVIKEAQKYVRANPIEITPHIVFDDNEIKGVKDQIEKLSADLIESIQDATKKEVISRLTETGDGYNEIESVDNQLNKIDAMSQEIASDSVGEVMVLTNTIEL